jgi:nicotinate-nucleotide adenylyltransferase
MSGILQVGLYGGAFDPPHRAHVGLAQAFKQQCALDALHIVPTGQATHRAQPLSDGAHRLAMARLAFGAFATIETTEIERPGPSYTFDTLTALRARYTVPARFWLLIGLDQWRDLDHWYRINDLRQLATIIVATRSTQMPAKSQFFDKELSESVPPQQRLNWQQMDFSATEIRGKAARGEALEGCVDVAVARYIEAQRLYKAPISDQRKA